MALIPCPDCGKLVSDQAPTCIGCGRPMFLQSGTSSSSQQWETCQIEWSTLKGALGLRSDRSVFWADAASPLKGSYAAGTSPEFSRSTMQVLGGLFGSGGNSYDYIPLPTHQDAVRAHSALVDHLLQDGWERTEIRGNSWWQHTFRRKDSASFALPFEITLFTSPHLATPLVRVPAGEELVLEEKQDLWARVRTTSGQVAYVSREEFERNTGALPGPLTERLPNGNLLCGRCGHENSSVRRSCKTCREPLSTQ